MANGGQASLMTQIKSAIPMIKAIRREITILLVVLAIGIVIGWFLFGWVIAPVQWTSAAPVDLQPTYRAFHLRLLSVALDSKAVSLDELRQLGLGIGVSDTRWSIDAVLSAIDDAVAKQPESAARYSALRTTLEALKQQEAAEAGGAQGAAPAPGINIGQIALIVLALVVIIFLTSILLRRLSRSAEQQAVPGPTFGAAIPGVARAAVPAAWTGETQPPLRQFDLTYVLGDDHFDMSNAIETKEGVFLGECGMGISEKIGTPNPDKVTALEVWLFDKNDIRTVTTVLLSDHAHTDRALYEKLKAKGEPARAEEGGVITLETKSLRLRARIADLEYGSGALPPNSFFQKVHVTMAAWQIGDGGVTQPAPPIQ